MSDLTDLRSLYSIFPKNITVEDLRMLEHFRRNLSHLFEQFPVSNEILALLIFLYGTISLFAIIGNVLVMFVVIYKRNMHTITNVFIANLALADVAIGIFTIPFQFHAALLQRWVFAEFMCKVAPFVKNLSVNVSILTLTVIAFDRYVAVMSPLRAGIRKQVAIIVLCFIWLISIICSVPEAVYYDTRYVFDPEIWSKKLTCTPEWPSEIFVQCYFSFLIILQYIVPLIVISVSYIRVSHRIWKSKPPGHEIEDRDQIRSIHKKKVVKMLIIVVSLFAICWLPLQAYNFIAAIYPDVNKFKYINIIWFSSNWLAMSNSCYNPFIYGLLNEKFKREFKNLLKICTCHRRQRTFLRDYFAYETSDYNMHKTSILYHGSDTSQVSRQSRKRRKSLGSTRSNLLKATKM